MTINGSVCSNFKSYCNEATTHDECIARWASPYQLPESDTKMGCYPVISQYTCEHHYQTNCVEVCDTGMSSFTACNAIPNTVHFYNSDGPSKMCIWRMANNGNFGNFPWYAYPAGYGGADCAAKVQLVVSTGTDTNGYWCWNDPSVTSFADCSLSTLHRNYPRIGTGTPYYSTDVDIASIFTDNTCTFAAAPTCVCPNTEMGRADFTACQTLCSAQHTQENCNAFQNVACVWGDNPPLVAIAPTPIRACGWDRVSTQTVQYAWACIGAGNNAAYGKSTQCPTVSGQYAAGTSSYANGVHLKKCASSNMQCLFSSDMGYDNTDLYAQPGECCWGPGESSIYQCVNTGAYTHSWNGKHDACPSGYGTFPPTLYKKKTGINANDCFGDWTAATGGQSDTNANGCYEGWDYGGTIAGTHNPL